MGSVVKWSAAMAAAVLLLAGCSDADEAASPATDGDFVVVLSFWPTSELDTSSGAPPVPDPAEQPSRIDLDLIWDDPADCFIWDRTVADSIGGGIRRNTASDFVLEDDDGVIVFTYTQNAGRCDEEFGSSDGTVKTFRSDVLVVDETTGQTGDALWVGVTEVREAG
jgi:hypothetical protein